MKDDFHQRVMETLADALERPDQEQREAFLCEACEGDPRLRRQVDSLLKAREQAGDFLGRSVFGERVGPWEEEPGTLVGPYRLIEELGRGGFGVVFLAEQQEPIRRRVALKIIKLGMDTKEVIARFEAERQALALLDHPNIAHVYDAGATEHGRPYFSLELVTGEPITRYCEHHRLSIKQRLELFLQVCDAVQHAHQRGIIHRDLKPSNIVVTELDGKPVPKVIDFGIAKSTHMRLTEATLVTRYDLLVGTPAYMSPEQAEMSREDVDTRSDIYSLGVLLYELLAGSAPLEAETLKKVALDEVRRMIRQQDPPRPSTRLWAAGQSSTGLAGRRRAGLKEAYKIIRNDLDWVVIKAIEKDPDRRYATVGDLSADLHRHLKHEPVSASPPSVSYRAQKFIQRHRTGVAASTVTFLALVVGLVFAGLGFARAEMRHTEAEATVRLLREMVGADSTYQSLGHEFSLGDMLDRFAEDLDERFRGHPALGGEVHDILARAYNGLTRKRAARAHHEKALQLRRQAYGPRHPKVADSLVECAWQIQVAPRSGEGPATAEKLVDEAIQIYRSQPSDPLALANGLGARSAFRYNLGKLDLAERDLREILELAEGRTTQDATRWAVQRGGAWSGLGNIAYSRGDGKEAESCYRRAVAQHRQGDNRLMLAHTLRRLGNILLATHRYSEAEVVIREEQDLWKWAHGEDHGDYRDAATRLQSTLEAQRKEDQVTERIQAP